MTNNSNMISLFDGTDLQNWEQIGDAEWRLTNGYVEGFENPGFLVSQQSYGDFRLIVEFWTDVSANSGIFIRCQDNENITSRNCYEVNIYDTRADQTYRTGAIANIAPPTTKIDAANQWNRFEILAQGSQLVITLNGTETVNVSDGQLEAGYIALQYSWNSQIYNTGVVRFREVSIQQL